MLTYEMIDKVNKEISMTDVKGKDYAEVNQRIKAFRKVCPNGSITSEIISLENGICVMKAVVYDGENNVLGTGHAYEKENSSYINKTSYIENCETSAVGRALGMCGFGINTSVASAEEVSNAIRQQETQSKPKTQSKPAAQSSVPPIPAPPVNKKPEITHDMIQDLYALAAFKNKSVEEVEKASRHYYRKPVAELTRDEFTALEERLQKISEVPEASAHA